jgi:hypothetical protein
MLFANPLDFDQFSWPERHEHLPRRLGDVGPLPGLGRGQNHLSRAIPHRPRLPERLQIATHLCDFLFFAAAFVFALGKLALRRPDAMVAAASPTPHACKKESVARKTPTLTV